MLCRGDGFATAASVIQNTGASDPNPFFRTLLGKSYVNKVIIAPHVYPPSITGLSNNYLLTAPGYFKRLSNSFGYLNKKACAAPALPPVQGSCRWLQLPRPFMCCGKSIRALPGVCFQICAACVGHVQLRPIQCTFRAGLLLQGEVPEVPGDYRRVWVPAA